MKKLGIVLITGIFILMCKKGITQKENPPVAKVDKIIIREGEIEAQFPSFSPQFIDEEQKKKMLDLGIEKILFYLAAKDEGLLKESEIKDKIKWAERLVVAEEYVKRKIESTIQISQREVENFYEINRKDFEKEIDVAYVIGTDKNELEEIRDRMIKSGPVKVISEIKPSPNLLANIEKTNLGVLKINPDLPTPFINLILSLKVGEISGVVEIAPYRYGVVQILDEGKSETKKEELFQLIHSFLFLQKSKIKRDSVLNILKQKYKVEIFKR
ncbi:MAG: peptidylprolyl isomerase [candidate division WOR-3 bacterium]